jgi:hypothetical protein
MATKSTTTTTKRQAKAKATTITTPEELGAVIEQAATGKAGTTTIQLKLAAKGADAQAKELKLATDRIRRVPRVKGWNALAVKLVGITGQQAELAITSAGQQATAWPTKEQATKASTKATKAPAKAKAKATTKRQAKVSLPVLEELLAPIAKKAPAKRTRKSA